MLDAMRSPSEPDRPAADLLAVLSPREAEVLDLASLGLTNAQIAARMSVTVHAVKFHLAGVYRKLGVGNRTEAVVHWLRREASFRVADAAEPAS
jgi:DNA-binding CsgD family transcriptional regulator